MVELKDKDASTKIDGTAYRGRSNASTDWIQSNQRPDPFAPLLVDHALGP
jgi:hypothetical protein